METICKLSKTEREEIVTTDLLDQPRNLKITDSSNINDIEILEYLLKMVSGHVVIKFNSSTTAHFVKSLLLHVKKLQKDKHDIRMSLEVPIQPYFELKFLDSDK